jgi:hypothetical protein
MIFAKDHKTRYIFDPWSFLGPKRKRLLKESWAGLFREHVLFQLPVNKIAPYFCSNFGRPSKEIYSAIGVLILQQMHDYSDIETVHQLAFNEQWHYALGIDNDESDAAKYMCPKTLWNFRDKVAENELEADIFDSVVDELTKAFSVGTDKQRVDSVHIKPNMRRLSRIGIFSRTIHSFLVNLKRQHKELFQTLSKELVERYFKKKALACFSQVKPSTSKKTLTSVSHDLLELVQAFKDKDDVGSMHTYKLLQRVLKEQCSITESEDAVEVIVKPPKEVPTDSLQNPSDPDAGYSGHKGQGYQVQLMETYSREDTPSNKPKELNLITYVKVEPANESDTKALIPALSSTTKRGLAPKEVLADSSYGSDENTEAANAMGVKVISPTMGKKPEGSLTLADFGFSETGEIAHCPIGQTPLQTKHKEDKHTIVFNSEHCLSCHKSAECLAKQGIKACYLHYTDKHLRLAMRRQTEQQPEFKDQYRYRAGIEATMSYYDRTTGVKRLRVRGLKAVRYYATLKAVGVNILRATAVKTAKTCFKATSESKYSAFDRIITVFKEQLGDISSHWQKILANFRPVSKSELIIAA